MLKYFIKSISISDNINCFERFIMSVNMYKNIIVFMNTFGQDVTFLTLHVVKWHRVSLSCLSMLH